MENTLDVNFLYLIISIIILITVYNVLLSTKEDIYNKKIVLETRKKIYEVPYDVCDVYLTNIRKNLKALYKGSNNYDNTKCKELRSFIDKTHADLQDYTNTNFSTDEMDILRYDVVTKFGLLKNSLESNTETAETDRAFTNILIDIEIILYMVRNSLCREKKLVLISLHNLMEQLYNGCPTNISDSSNNPNASNPNMSNPNTSNPEMSKNLEAFTNREEFYDITGLDIIGSNIVYAGAPGPSMNTDLSQNIEKNVLDDEEYSNDKETIHKPFSLSNNTNKIDKKRLVSQDFECSADYILTSKSSQPYTPFCDINKLRRERAKIQAKTMDLNFNRSLRNDYDYLDA